MLPFKPLVGGKARMKAVLIALSEQDLAQALAHVLQQRGFTPIVAQSSEQGVRLAEQTELALLVTDVLLASTAGKGLQVWVREQPRHNQLPTLVITPVPTPPVAASDNEVYLSKPIDVGSFVTQVEGLIGTADVGAYPDDHLTIGPLTLNLRSFALQGNSCSVLLTPTEFRLLTALARNPGAAITAASLLEEIWNGQAIGGVALVRVHIRNLRKKLVEACGEDPHLIVTQPRIGYSLRHQGQRSA